MGFLMTRPMTLGVRGIALTPDDRVMLVRHGYVSGWHFPGGGVEIGETCEEAVRRELEEESRIVVNGAPSLHGLFFNAKPSRRDHIAVYVIRDFTVLGERLPDREIQESRLFPRDSLPQGTTDGTRARLLEVFGAAPHSDRW